MLFTRLLQSHEYSDFTVQCGDRVWSVHRAILCSRSRYFKKVCSSGFKVRTSVGLLGGDKSITQANVHFQESTDFKIAFTDEDPIMIEYMITYLYSLKYPRETRVLSNMAADLLFDVKMYAVAEKYDLSLLKTQAKRAFAKLLNSKSDAITFGRLLDLSSEIGHGSIGELIAGLARIVYTSTPDGDRGLRDIIKKFTWRHKKILMADKELQKCIIATEGYMVDVVQSLFKDNTSEREETSPPLQSPKKHPKVSR